MLLDAQDTSDIKRKLDAIIEEQLRAARGTRR